MSKYDRIDPSLAVEPCPRMRIYGRYSSGKIGRIVIHCVENGNVYATRVVRGNRGAWPFVRWDLGNWTAAVRGAITGGEIIGVQVPRATASAGRLS
jgi:hypothetical protein